MSKELIELNKRMKKQIIAGDDSEITKLREQVAAQAAVIESLKEALHYSLGAWEYDGVSDEHGSIFKEANDRCDIPTNSTQILDEVRRAEREKCANVCRDQSVRFAEASNGNATYGAHECDLAIRAME